MGDQQKCNQGKTASAEFEVVEGRMKGKIKFVDVHARMREGIGCGKSRITRR